MKGAHGAAVAEALGRPRYEVIPLDGVVDKVVEHVPKDVTVTVTASPRKGIDATLEVAERLAERGYAVVPHLSARLVADRAHLRDVLARLRRLGVHDAFVIAGDVPEPLGEFAGALDLLVAMAELGHDLDEIGISGYPESHPFISDDVTIQAMWDKRHYATYIVSQICFDPQVTAEWVAAVCERGTRLPIHIGLPGAVSRSKLLRVSQRIGVGESIRLLQNDGAGGDDDFDPGPLVEGLEASVHERRNVAGFHIFTFNELERTEYWRQRMLAPVRSK